MDEDYRWFAVTAAVTRIVTTLCWAAVAVVFILKGTPIVEALAGNDTKIDISVAVKGLGTAGFGALALSNVRLRRRNRDLQDELELVKAQHRELSGRQ